MIGQPANQAIDTPSKSCRHLSRIQTEIFISPAGAVDKATAATVDIRLINDYSIPPVHSINDFTDHESLPSISYNPPRDTANRIHFIASSHLVEHVLMMIGDVSGAFRHISIHADSVHVFAFVFEDRLVVDLSCGFGWCGSPAFYTLVGSIINAMYEHGNKLNRQFHGNVWCDDHTCIEVDRGSACFNANLSLRWAMATDTSAGTVSIPVDKLTKASDRVDDLVSSKFATRTIQLQVIGSFRHVASSLPPARAFLQCLQEKATACPKYCRRVLSASTLDDLRWFQAVLRHPARFNAIPIIHFADMSESRFHVFTDASGDGLYVLEPTLKRYIHQRFSTEDLTDTSIHVRKLRSAVLAALHWGPYRASESNTTSTHVQFHIDNTNAVAWANHRPSRHSVVKMHNRLLSLAEFQYNLVFTASHIADKLNMMADAGSRVIGSKRLSTIYAASGLVTQPKRPGKLHHYHIYSTLGSMVSICYADELDEMVNTGKCIETIGILCHLLLDRWMEQSPHQKSTLDDQVKTCQYLLVPSSLQEPCATNESKTRLGSSKYQASIRTKT
ncbi:hypothetical protein L915_13868 [Phytophthora nicotianae]|uniref:Uncharacterized protein n=1 Tax=Phytophthora nicotianae TaxID=4792 RepID=W2GBN7_PHYNI|nr:hypothetical protein L915_13868 [Phytophthora nicotianae]